MLKTQEFVVGSLKGEKLQTFKDKMLKEEPRNLEDETNKMWSAVAKCIKRISKQVLGESNGKGPRSKEN